MNFWGGAPHQAAHYASTQTLRHNLDTVLNLLTQDFSEEWQDVFLWRLMQLGPDEQNAWIMREYMQRYYILFPEIEDDLPVYSVPQMILNSPGYDNDAEYWEFMLDLVDATAMDVKQENQPGHAQLVPPQQDAIPPPA